MRKSLALLDEPEASYQHFAALVTLLIDIDNDNDAKQVMALRQMSICLWILFGWAREAENMEVAYLSSELTLLFGWKIVSLQVERRGKITQGVELAFFSIFSAYQQICSEFLLTNIIPHAGKPHALSIAVQTSCSLDINLKLFDLLGRLAIHGIWAQWIASQPAAEGTDVEQHSLQAVIQTMTSVKSLILANPVLLLPVQDDQAIDVSIATFLLLLDVNNHDFVKQWLAEILKRASFAYQVHGQYPCNLRSYSKLLSHPNENDIAYRKEVTNGSILYPLISLCAAILQDEETYNYVADFKKEFLQHCNFQFWYPDEFSETNFYTNSDLHGAVLSNVFVDRSSNEFLAQVFGECDETPYFKEMSAVKFDWLPLVIVGCRHHRLPLPLHFLQELFMKTSQPDIR